MEILSGDAVSAAVASEACNLLLYGGPGIGKTTEAVKAFIRDGRCLAFYVQAEEGALKSILAHDPPLPMPDTVKGVNGVHTVVGWDQLWACLMHVAQNRGKYTALIIDTLTAWTASTMLQLQQAGFGNKNGWAIPVLIRDYLTVLRNVARQLGVHVIYTAHARDPYVEDGVFYQGGPSLSPKKAGTMFYGAVDTMLRAEIMQVQGKSRRVYITGGLEWDTTTLGMAPTSWHQWFQKNREAVQQAVVPADLGAYLRARKPPYPGL